MTNCPTCGARNSDIAYVCWNCGAVSQKPTELIKLRRRAVDKIFKDDGVARKVIEFLNIK